MPFAHPEPEEGPFDFSGVLVCPHCGKHHTDHTVLNERPVRPHHGDVSLCIRCGQIGVFDAHQRAIRLPSAAEWAEFALLPEVQAARRAWRKVVAH